MYLLFSRIVKWPKLLLLLLYSRLRTVFSRCENVAKEHLEWTVGNGDRMHGGVSHTAYLAHGNSKCETKQTRIIVRNSEEWNVGV